MEEYRKENWMELVEKVEAAGVDAIEINFSCPHGMPGEEEEGRKEGEKQEAKSKSKKRPRRRR